MERFERLEIPLKGTSDNVVTFKPELKRDYLTGMSVHNITLVDELDVLGKTYSESANMDLMEKIIYPEHGWEDKPPTVTTGVNLSTPQQQYSDALYSLIRSFEDWVDIDEPQDKQKETYNNHFNTRMFATLQVLSCWGGDPPSSETSIRCTIKHHYDGISKLKLKRTIDVLKAKNKDFNAESQHTKTIRILNWNDAAKPIQSVTTQEVVFDEQQLLTMANAISSVVDEWPQTTDFQRQHFYFDDAAGTAKKATEIAVRTIRSAIQHLISVLYGKASDGNQRTIFTKAFLDYNNIFTPTLSVQPSTQNAAKAEAALREKMAAKAWKPIYKTEEGRKAILDKNMAGIIKMCKTTGGEFDCLGILGLNPAKDYATEPFELFWKQMSKVIPMSGEFDTLGVKLAEVVRGRFEAQEYFIDFPIIVSFPPSLQEQDNAFDDLMKNAPTYLFNLARGLPTAGDPNPARAKDNLTTIVNYRDTTIYTDVIRLFIGIEDSAFLSLHEMKKKFADRATLRVEIISLFNATNRSLRASLNRGLQAGNTTAPVPPPAPRLLPP